MDDSGCYSSLYALKTYKNKIAFENFYSLQFLEFDDDTEVDVQTKSELLPRRPFVVMKDCATAYVLSLLLSGFFFFFFFDTVAIFSSPFSMLFGHSPY